MHTKIRSMLGRSRWYAVGAKYADHPFAKPFADPDGVIGKTFFEEYARREGLKLVDPGASAALIPRFESLASATFDPERVSASIRAFYTRTYHFTMKVQGGWRFPFTLGSGFYGFLAGRIEQLDVPDLDDGVNQEMQSRFGLIDLDHDGAYDCRVWIRRMKSTGDVFYVAAVHHFTDDRHSYISLSFPFWRSNLAVVLRLENGPGDSFAMSTHGGRDSVAGTYVVKPHRGERFSMVRMPGMHETFFFESKTAGSVPYIQGEHRATSFGASALVLRYLLVERSAAAPSPPYEARRKIGTVRGRMRR